MKHRTVKATPIVLALALVLAMTSLFGCGCGKEARTEVLTIYHAGSLSVPFSQMEAEFEETHPDVDVLCESGGSAAMINKSITREEAGEAPPDIIASADYKLIPERLYEPGYADWNIIFAGNKMVLCYRDGAPYADEIENGSETWYHVLRSGEVTWGHSDPDDDPCGYRTLMVFQLAEEYYYDQAAEFGLTPDPDADGLYDACIPGSEHERGRASQGQEIVRSKSIDLVALLQSGDLDYAFEYSSVAVQHGLNFIDLDGAINLSQTGEIGDSGISYEDFYAEASVEIVKSAGPPPTYEAQVGAPIVYGITITENAPNSELAAEFIELLLSETGREILEGQNGQPCFVPARCDYPERLPSSLSPLVATVRIPVFTTTTSRC